AIGWRSRPAALVRASRSAMADGTRLDFSVLGSVQMTVDGEPVKLGTPKQRAVLATLITNRSHTVGVDTLITDAWEQRPPRNPTASVHTLVVIPSRSAISWPHHRRCSRGQPPNGHDRES